MSGIGQMDWTAQVDAYCERVDPSFWAEPVNAITNVAFVMAAVIMWRRTARMPLARLLCVILAVIGVGSFLFHTTATRWAAMADSAPIGIFILTYLLAVNLHVWRWPIWGAVLGTLAFVPYLVALTPVFAALPFFAISAFYWPVPLLILLYAVVLRRRYPIVARGWAIGAAILTLSLVFRSLDQRLCGPLPVGTHFLWHILNATMLGWMIEVYRRHLLATGRRQR